MAPKLSSLLRNSSARRLAGRVIKPLRRAAQRNSPRAGILMYHRVAAEEADPWNLCVTPEAFDEQMEVLARRRAAVDLAAFGDGSAYGKAGDRIAVTFDDAYSDNLAAALPILEKHEIPATIFVVTGALGQRHEFWWDALVRVVLESGRVPQELSLELGGRRFEFRIEDGSEVAPASGWDADHDEPRTDRERLYLNLWNAIVVLEPEEQNAAAEQVLVWAGLPAKGPEHRYPATRDQIAALASHPLIRVGSHTRHHVSLPHLTSARQREEIAGGHRDLEELVGRRLDRFSYPFGRYDCSALDHVRELQVAVACTSRPAVATAAMSRTELPRLHATQRDGDSFARWLRDDHGLLAGR